MDKTTGKWRRSRVLTLCVVLVCLVPLTGGLVGEGWYSGFLVGLHADGWDMELDPTRDRIYVSIPSRNEVAVISTRSWSVVERVVVGTQPHGVDISLDESLLFVALHQASSVVYITLDDLSFTQVVIGAELGDPRTWDVVEAKPDRVFASANASSSGFSYIVMIKRDAGNAASRVADGRIIRAGPIFAASPISDYLYVGEGFSPESLYKLDLSTDLAPIVLEDQHGAVSGTDHLVVNSDGSRIYLGSGRVLRTSDFIQIGMVASGVPALNAAGTRLYMANPPDTIDIYETVTFLKTKTVHIPCAFTDIRKLELLNDGRGFLVLGDDVICGVTGTPGFWIAN